MNLKETNKYLMIFSALSLVMTMCENYQYRLDEDILQFSYRFQEQKNNNFLICDT